MASNAHLPAGCSAPSGWGTRTSRKPQIGVASSWNEITPCNLSLQRLAQAAKEGVHAAGGYPLEFAHDLGVRRHLDGSRGDALLAGQPRDHRRLGRDRHGGRAPGRHGHVRRLRQVAAGHAHGRGAARRGQRVRLRRFDPARSRDTDRRFGARRHDHRRVRGRRRVRAGSDVPRRCRPDRAGHLPGRRCLRRHVHRQHDGQHRRGDRDVPARFGGTAGHRPSPRRVRPPVGRGRGRAAASGDHRAADHDPGGLRERHHGAHGVRWLDERGPAPARAWPTRPTSRSRWRTSTGSVRRSRSWPTSSRSAATS